MSATENGPVLDHTVELFIPTQCGVCQEPLPEDAREALLKDIKGRFFDAFGGFSVTRIHGGWRMPDGTLAEEPVDVVWAKATKQAIEEHADDARLWAVEVADRASQDLVALCIDQRMAFFPRSNPKAPCVHKTAGKVTATAAAMQAAALSAAAVRPIDRLYAIQSILSRFASLADARALFCGILSYTYADASLPTAKWPETLTQVLRGSPQIISDTNGFRIVYLRLNADRLLRTSERAVISRILRDDPSFHGLFVVSDAPQQQWRLVNPKQETKDSARFLLRRIPVGPRRGVRTATERLGLVDLENRANHSAAAIQELHDQAFDVESVTKQFFLEIANWYFWALKHAKFPEHAPKEADGLDHISIIRLITRLIFCWFVKEKGLIPEELFDQRQLERILIGFEPEKPSNKDSVFYRAILQNLFFATLNTEMDKRGWAKDDQNFMAHSLYRYRECFQKPSEALGLFKSIPFLNGGLFECLDEDLGEGARPRYIRIDGFSRRDDSQPTVPDFLFFGPECEVDLSKDYGDNRFKKVVVRGLVHTLRRYNFTIEENTPIDQEVALDPELSGKVFENLLAAYNPETGATARKETGSFYTPREIVDYMVDEVLIAYLETKLQAGVPSAKEGEPRLRHLLALHDEPPRFSPAEADALIAAIDHLKALDPAVGSGAFPMGILHKLVFILGKLDPRNEKWKERQIQRVRDAMVTAERIEDATIREATLQEIEEQIASINEAFEHNEMDYGRKLYLIENCIYGVDIQPIAVQIAKMRFFISLIVDQKVDSKAPNVGVRPLPNLETKFVAANTLIGVNRPGQQVLRNREIESKEAELRRVRERHFLARTLKLKAECREDDACLRSEIADLLKADGWDTATARKLASWDPYDQNASATFFDPEWMFGATSHFDVIIGNPPWGQKAVSLRDSDREWIARTYQSCAGIFDYFRPFVERGIGLIKTGGSFAMVLPDILLLKDYPDTRRYILDRLTLRAIDWWGMAFDSVVLDTVTIIGTKNTASPSHRVRVAVNDPGNLLRHEIPQNDFCENPRFVFNLFLTPEKRDVLSKLAKCPRLGNFFAAHEGVHSGNMRSELFVDQALDRTCKPLLFGRDEISAYHLSWNGKFIRLGAAPHTRTKERYANLGRPEWYAQKKILVRRTGDYVLAALDEEKRYASNNFFILFPKATCSLTLEGLCALLNSRFMTWYFRTIEPREGRVFAELKIKHLEVFPLPTQIESPNGCDKINSLGSERIRLTEQLAQVSRLKEDGACDALDREIDREVTNLFQISQLNITNQQAR